MTPTRGFRSRPQNRFVALVAVILMVMGVGLSACGSEDSDHHADSTDTIHAASVSTDVSPAQAALQDGMRTLWFQHMEWTYATVAAFAAGSKGLQPTLDRLLANQTQIGDAIKPYYGDEAGTALTTLLKAHINGAVPILVAAKAGNTADLNKSVAAWYVNAKEIADFLAKANPQWPKADMEDMMKGHIDQTLVYATAQLQGRYAASITAYGEAEAHMVEMADMLTAGIVKQFPDKFTS